jgi:predicted PurR-regulated permease PerM
MLPTVVHLPPRRRLTPWLVALVIFALAVVFRRTLTLGFAAFSIAYVFAPSVKRLQRWGLPRSLAILVILLGTSALVGGAAAALLPELGRQIESLLTSLPEYSAAIQRSWIPYLRHHWHLHIPPRTEDVLAQLGLRASAIAPRIGSILNDTLGYTIVIVEMLFTGLIVLALAFYMLVRFDSIIASAFEVVPYRSRERVRTIAMEIDSTLRHFVQGQLLVMVILGALYAVGLGVLGVPAGWAIGVFAGLISFVPYLGFFVALGLALLMSAISGSATRGLLGVTAVMTFVHVLDLTLITPRILGGRAKLSPIVVILALVAGASVFGFVGVLVAIPVASVIRVLLREVVAYYKTTPFFLTQAPPGALQSVPFTAPSALTSDLSAALFASPSQSGATSREAATVPEPIRPAESQPQTAAAIASSGSSRES